MRFFLGPRSVANLRGVHPDLVRVVELALAYTEYDFAVDEGARDIVRQKRLVDAGLSMTMDSKHLPQPDGFAWAVDVRAVGDLDHDGRIDERDKLRTWDREVYTAIARAMKRAAADLGVKIRWGGDFKTRAGQPFFDGPHFELAGPISFPSSAQP